MAPDAENRPGPVKPAAAPSTPPSPPGAPAAPPEAPEPPPVRVMLSFNSGRYDLPNEQAEALEPDSGRWTVEKRFANKMVTVMGVVFTFTCLSVTTLALFAAGSHSGLIPDVLPRMADVNAPH